MFAQTSFTTEAVNFFNSGDLEKAKKSIDQASANSETTGDARTWFFRGMIYKEIYKTKESTDPFSPARNTGADAFEKAISLDKAGEYTEDSRKALKYLVSTFFNDAAKALNAENYKVAFSNYDNYLVRQSRLNPNAIDTEALFYAGYSAYMEKQAEKAKSYLEKAQSAGFVHPYLFYFLGKIYLTEGSTDKGQQMLETGYYRFPQDKNIILTLISFYQEKNKFKELESILLKELQKGENTEYQLLLGVTYQKLLEEHTSQRAEYSEKAKKAYLRVLQKDPENLKANYNMGLVYYNDAVIIINALDYDMDMVALEDIQEECKEIFKKALPYMEKAYTLNPKNKETLTGLSGIYFSLREDDKYKRIKAEAESLDKQ